MWWPRRNAYQDASYGGCTCTCTWTVNQLMDMHVHLHNSGKNRPCSSAISYSVLAITALKVLNFWSDWQLCVKPFVLVEQYLWFQWSMYVVGNYRQMKREACLVICCLGSLPWSMYCQLTWAWTLYRRVCQLVYTLTVCQGPAQTTLSQVCTNLCLSKTTSGMYCQLTWVCQWPLHGLPGM